MNEGKPFEGEEDLQSGKQEAPSSEIEQTDADVAEIRAQLTRLRQDLNSCAAALKSLAKRKSLAVSDNVRDLIEENPGPALLSAFAGGLIIGLLLQRPAPPYYSYRRSLT